MKWKAVDIGKIKRGVGISFGYAGVRQLMKVTGVQVLDNIGILIFVNRNICDFALVPSIIHIEVDRGVELEGMRTMESSVGTFCVGYKGPVILLAKVWTSWESAMKTIAIVSGEQLFGVGMVKE